MILIKFQNIKLDLVDGNNSDSISRPSFFALALSFSLSFCHFLSWSINNDITDIARSLLRRLMALLEECAACRFGLADFFVKSFILYAIYKYNCLCVRVCIRVCV